MFIPKAKYEELMDEIDFLKVDARCDEKVIHRLKCEVEAYWDVINQFLDERKLTCEDYSELHRRRRIAAAKLVEYHDSISGEVKEL